MSSVQLHCNYLRVYRKTEIEGKMFLYLLNYRHCVLEPDKIFLGRMIQPIIAQMKKEVEQ